MQVHFIKPFEGTAQVYMTTTTLPANQTKVIWGMEGKNEFPFNLMNLFIPGMLGKDMDTSLRTLKIVLEKS